MNIKANEETKVTESAFGKKYDFVLGMNMICSF